MNHTKKIISVLIAVLASAGTIFAQQDIEKTLRYAGDVAILYEDGTFMKLNSMKVKLTITNTMIANVPESQNRTAASEEIKLVANIPAGVRPQNCLNIIKMNKSGDKLVHQFSRLMGFGFLEFDVEPYGDNLTLLILRNYEPGEYLLRYYTDVKNLAMTQQDGILFGLN